MSEISIQFALPTVDNQGMSVENQSAIILNQAVAAITVAWINNQSAIGQDVDDRDDFQVIPHEQDVVQFIKRVQEALKTY